MCTVRLGWGVGEHFLDLDNIRMLYVNKWLIRSMMMGGERLMAGQYPLITLMLPVSSCPCLTWFTGLIIWIGYPFPLPKQVVWQVRYFLFWVLQLRLSRRVDPHPLLTLPDGIFEPWVLLVNPGRRASCIICVHVKVKDRACRRFRSS